MGIDKSQDWMMPIGYESINNFQKLMYLKCQAMPCFLHWNKIQRRIIFNSRFQVFSLKNSFSTFYNRISNCLRQNVLTFYYSIDTIFLFKHLFRCYSYTFRVTVHLLQFYFIFVLLSELIVILNKIHQ